MRNLTLLFIIFIFTLIACSKNREIQNTTLISKSNITFYIKDLKTLLEFNDSKTEIIKDKLIRDINYINSIFLNKSNRVKENSNFNTNRKGSFNNDEIRKNKKETKRKINKRVEDLRDKIGLNLELHLTSYQIDKYKNYILDIAKTALKGSRSHGKRKKGFGRKSGNRGRGMF